MPTALATAYVREWMIGSPPVITPRTTIATALRLLREHTLPALPVCEAGRLRGLVSERALLRLTPSEVTTLDVYELRESSTGSPSLASPSRCPIPSVPTPPWRRRRQCSCGRAGRWSPSWRARIWWACSRTLAVLAAAIGHAAPASTS